MKYFMVKNIFHKTCLENSKTLACFWGKKWCFPVILLRKKFMKIFTNFPTKQFYSISTSLRPNLPKFTWIGIQAWVLRIENFWIFKFFTWAVAPMNHFLKLFLWSKCGKKCYSQLACSANDFTFVSKFLYSPSACAEIWY